MGVSMINKSTPARIWVLFAGLAYVYCRLVIELITQSSSFNALPYLIGLLLGLHGLIYWYRRLSAEKEEPPNTHYLTLHLAGLVIVCIALLMDGARLLLEIG